MDPYYLECLGKEFKAINTITNNSVATAILMLNNTLTSQVLWDNFGHELAISIRCALFGGGAEGQKSDADIRQGFDAIADALREDR